MIFEDITVGGSILLSFGDVFLYVEELDHLVQPRLHTVLTNWMAKNREGIDIR